MFSVFAQVTPLALAADISPSGLLFVMMILSNRDNGKKKALSFIIGATAFLTVLGIFTMLTFRAAAGRTGHATRLSGVLDIALALLILAIVAKSARGAKKDKPAKKKKKEPPFLVLGFSYMIINISTLIPFIAAAKIIAAAKLGLTDTSTLFAAVLLIAMFMVAFPVLISYVAPEKSQTILGPVQMFMRARGKEIANIYFLIMAVYLLVRGILILR
ncbi:MAG: GAP family protein [Actinomycetota bacterium]|nr:GAP family protein [Actinomycetota bacterium]